MILPDRYISFINDLLKEETDDYLNALDHPFVHGLRINTNKISVEDFLKINPFHLESVPWTDNGFIYDENKDDPSRHPYYQAGLYYLQEPSAMAPAQFLPIEENDFVLDACCAPGGKSSELASRLKGTGLLIANDISSSRQNATIKNIELFGLTNSYITSSDVSDMAMRFNHFFDKILLDVPCSGQGMFRKDHSLVSEWEKRDSSYYVPIQKEIGLNALRMLKDGGMLLYSTCTFDPKEDEEIIQFLLDQEPTLHLVSIPYDGFEKGVNGLDKCCRLYPHKLKGEGHFLALLQKGKKKDLSALETVIKDDKLPSSVIEFLKQIKSGSIPSHYKIIKNKVYAISFDLSDKHILTLRSNLLLGEIKPNTFEPSQALAMALKKEQFNNTLDLSLDDSRVMKYLKGETIFSDQVNQGYVLVCVDGFPLGFAKNDHNQLKNKRNPGWRIQ